MTVTASPGDLEYESWFYGVDLDRMERDAKASVEYLIMAECQALSDKVHWEFKELKEKYKPEPERPGIAALSNVLLGLQNSYGSQEWLRAQCGAQMHHPSWGSLSYW